MGWMCVDRVGWRLLALLTLSVCFGLGCVREGCAVLCCVVDINVMLVPCAEIESVVDFVTTNLGLLSLFSLLHFHSRFGVCMYTYENR